MFDGTDHEQHTREAEERWGDTEAWAQSQQRMAALGPDGAEQAKAWWADHVAQFAALRTADVPLEDDRVRRAVADHRALLNRFYDCGPEMQRSLAAMYVGDDRFRTTYDAHAEGLATYVRDAVELHADAV